MKKLPLDLVPLIFEHVRGDRDALRCFALVHTSWSLPAQRLLFDTVTIGLLQEWKWLLHTLMSSPRLRSLVHELVWSVIRPWSQVLPCYQTHVPELLPNVTKLTFQGEVIIDLPLMSALPSLETLVIRCDYAWFNELHDPPPVEIALWPSCIRSVHIEQSRIAICSLRWFDMNMIVNPVRTASIYGPVEHVPQMRRFVERHTDLEHLSVDIEGYRGVYGPEFHTGFRSDVVHTFCLRLSFEMVDNAGPMLFGIICASHFPSLRSLRLAVHVSGIGWFHDYIDPFSSHPNPNEDAQWILPVGMASALTTVVLVFSRVDGVKDLVRLLGLLGAANRPGVVSVRVVTLIEPEKAQTYRVHTAAMEPLHAVSY